MLDDIHKNIMNTQHQLEQLNITYIEMKELNSYNNLDAFLKAICFGEPVQIELLKNILRKEEHLGRIKKCLQEVITFFDFYYPNVKNNDKKELAEKGELEKQVNAMARPTTPTTFTPTRTPVTTPTPRYSANQINIIKQALDQGATIEQIQAALSRKPVQDGTSKELLDKVNAIENYLQQSAYDKAQTEFVNKLTAFGDKFGLSENDLVVFGNTALAKGINIAQVSDLESVFRAIYPEQYAIRVQRMQHTPTSQIFGGSTMFINPTAMSEQAADNYVEGFLKGAMPNQYRKK